MTDPTTPKPNIHIHIDASEKRPELPECGTYQVCPKCEGPLTQGFGLAGGGFGVYDYCEACGEVIAKTTTPDDMDI